MLSGGQDYSVASDGPRGILEFLSFEVKTKVALDDPASQDRLLHLYASTTAMQLFKKRLKL